MIIARTIAKTITAGKAINIINAYRAPNIKPRVKNNSENKKHKTFVEHQQKISFCGAALQGDCD